ncbi:MAG: uracil-DNA glycosylase family protein [Anaerolineae bacterium]|nr:uracil-DNA glycosylase family protein [Anaerolineae bacterium]
MSSRSSVSTEQALDALHSEMRACRRCLEAGFAITPGAIFSGPAGARVMIVGQAPGVTEVEAKRPFNASSGRRLFQWLGKAGWEEAEFRATQYMTAVTKCFPGKSPGGRGDRASSRAEQKLCAPFLERELALVTPEIIIPVGGLAISRFLGEVKLVEVIGTAVQDSQDRWVVPLPHPSGASLWLNKPEHQALVQRAIEHLRKLKAKR